MLANSDKPSAALSAVAAAAGAGAGAGGADGGSGANLSQLGAFAFQLLDMQEDKARAYNDRLADLRSQKAAKEKLRAFGTVYAGWGVGYCVEIKSPAPHAIDATTSP